MKCILHIGTEKTGTTSIQDFVFENVGLFSEKGVALSGALGSGNNRHLPAFFQTNVDDLCMRLGLYDLDNKARYFQKHLDQFEQEVAVARADHDVFLISSEHLHSRLRTSHELQALKAFLAPLFDGIEIHAYFRSQESLVQSIYSTWLEGGGGTKTLEQFAQDAVEGNPYYDYMALSEMWTQAFGAAAYHPKLYRRSDLFDGDVRKDLLRHALGISDFSAFDFRSIESNRSMGSVGISIARTLNTVLPRSWPLGPKDKLRKAIMRAFVLSGIARLGAQTFADAAQIKARFERSNEAFTKAYFGRSGNIFEKK